MDEVLILAKKVIQLQQQVQALQADIEAVSKQAGPQGVQGPPGPKGKDGINGKDGLNGQDGKNGKDGVDGQDGISVVDAKVDLDGSLVLTLSDGSEIDAGSVVSVNNRGDLTVYKSGAVQVSKYTDTILAIDGYVEITDADGITRKLAVVS